MTKTPSTVGTKDDNSSNETLFPKKFYLVGKRGGGG